MKKSINMIMMCLVVLSFSTLSSCTTGSSEVAEDTGLYVDLGLSSGTKWKTVNEKNDADVGKDLFTYFEAKNMFGDELPSSEQYMELVNECQWTWKGMGYKIVGPNGESITLPAVGFINIYDNNKAVGSKGYYWSSTLYDDTFAWELEFDSCKVFMSGLAGIIGCSVRLVQD